MCDHGSHTYIYRFALCLLTELLQSVLSTEDLVSSFFRRLREILSVSQLVSDLQIAVLSLVALQRPVDALIIILKN